MNNQAQTNSEKSEITGRAPERKFRWDDDVLDRALDVYWETRKRIPDGEAAVRAAIRAYVAPLPKAPTP